MFAGEPAEEQLARLLAVLAGWSHPEPPVVCLFVLGDQLARSFLDPLLEKNLRLLSCGAPAAELYLGVSALHTSPVESSRRITTHECDAFVARLLRTRVQGIVEAPVFDPGDVDGLTRVLAAARSLWMRRTDVLREHLPAGARVGGGFASRTMGYPTWLRPLIPDLPPRNLIVAGADGPDDADEPGGPRGDGYLRAAIEGGAANVYAVPADRPARVVAALRRHGLPFVFYQGILDLRVGLERHRAPVAPAFDHLLLTCDENVPLWSQALAEVVLATDPALRIPVRLRLVSAGPGVPWSPVWAHLGDPERLLLHAPAPPAGQVGVLRTTPTSLRSKLQRYFPILFGHRPLEPRQRVRLALDVARWWLDPGNGRPSQRIGALQDRHGSLICYT
jgi:hypothetical protein